MKNTPAAKPKFNLGQIVVTSGVQTSIPLETIEYSLARHVRGDWGGLNAEDVAENDRGIAEGTRLMSVYDSPVRHYVITEWDRSVTTVLLPEEY